MGAKMNDSCFMLYDLVAPGSSVHKKGSMNERLENARQPSGYTQVA